MKLRRKTNIGFYFTGLEGFVLAAPNGFALTGKSIGDILNTWMQPASQRPLENSIDEEAHDKSRQPLVAASNLLEPKR